MLCFHAQNTGDAQNDSSRILIKQPSKHHVAINVLKDVCCVLIFPLASSGGDTCNSNDEAKTNDFLNGRLPSLLVAANVQLI